LLRKQRKNLGVHFFLPHPVGKTIVVYVKFLFDASSQNY